MDNKRSNETMTDYHHGNESEIGQTQVDLITRLFALWKEHQLAIIVSVTVYLLKTLWSFEHLAML